MIEADIYDGQIVIVSEYVTDGSLAAWIKQQGGHAPSIETASELIEGVLSGLAHLHGRNIIHRDLKPDNVLLQNETPRLADFGIARLLKSGSYSTNISGTLAYMAPEAFDGKRNEQTDVWSAGVIFYQLLSGRLPYDQADMASFVGAIMRNDPPPLPESVPEVLRAIVVKALNRDPAARYTSAKEMRRELREAEHMLWQSDQRPLVAVPMAPPPARVPQPTVKYTVPAETEKLDPDTLPKPIRPLAPDVSGKKSNTRTPLILAGIVGVVLIVSLLAMGVLVIVKSLATNSTPTANANKSTPASKTKPKTGKYALIRTLEGHSEDVWSVVYSRDGKSIATGSGDDTVKLWDAQTGALKRSINAGIISIFSVAYSPDGKTLACSGYNNDIKLFDTQTGALKQSLTGHSGNIYSVTFSPDGKTIASASVDKTVKTWDAQSGSTILTLTGHDDTVFWVTFSPDGKTIASVGDDKTVRLWNAQTGELTQTFTGHTDLIWSVAFSPDGQTLASASKDGSIKLWDIQSSSFTQSLTGHSGFVRFVAFSPDGTTLASSGDDKTVRIWNTQTWTLTQTIAAHNGYAMCVTFSPDGKTLASSGNDHLVKLWEIE